MFAELNGTRTLGYHQEALLSHLLFFLPWGRREAGRMRKAEEEGEEGRMGCCQTVRSVGVLGMF